jgi:hypothetical protein
MPKPGKANMNRSKAAVKVSPNVIKQIKTLGMTKALASAKSNKGNKAYITGLTRMYGANKVNAALGYKAAAGKSIPAGGVMGTKRAQVMAGPIKSTMKKTAASKVAKNSAPKAAKNSTKTKSGNFKNGKSFSEFMNTKTKRFGTY